jgi:hypothetical protein
MGISVLRIAVFSTLFMRAVFAQDATTSGANCTFKADPDRFLAAQSRVRSQLVQHTATLTARISLKPDAQVDPATIPHKNFIDDEIFGTMAKAGIASAPLSGDEEFFRRINLDLTGRIPTSANIRAFAANKPDRTSPIPAGLKNARFVPKISKRLFTPRSESTGLQCAAMIRSAAGSSTCRKPDRIRSRRFQNSGVKFA